MSNQSAIGAQRPQQDGMAQRSGSCCGAPKFQPDAQQHQNSDKGRWWSSRLPYHLVFLAITMVFPSVAAAHEAWLLTPSEIEELSVMPLPSIFTSTPLLLGLALLAGIAAFAALMVEDKYRDAEEKFFAPISRQAARFGPLFIRVGLALMMALGALGGLPRHGVAMWTKPTLMVPDMQLALVGGSDLIVELQIVLAALLILGLLTRLAAVGVIGLAITGIVLFGVDFLSYAPHFIAPALILMVWGSGPIALDEIHRPLEGPRPTEAQAKAVWSMALFFLGGTFVYLAIVYKFGQPTLLMAILKHGEVPTLGLPYEYAAMGMMAVELIAGALLAMGRLVRPIAVFLIFAFTFFAVTIGETPLFHANLYGTMAMLLIVGRRAPNLEKRSETAFA